MWDCERNQEAKFFYNSPRLPGGTGEKLLKERYANHSHKTSKQNQEFRYIREIYIGKIKVLRLIRVTSEKGIHDVSKTAAELC